MALPQAIDIRISMLRLAPQCFAFTSYYRIITDTDTISIFSSIPVYLCHL